MVSELVSQPHFATEAGTRRFVQRHAPARGGAEAYSDVGRLHLSSLGAGTYLGPPDDATDARYVEALVEAVRQGLNVIDTAANYRAGRAERCVGQALSRLTQMGEIFRSEVLVSSKAGLVTPEAGATDPLAGLRAATVGAGLCADDELCCSCHCMAPAFLRASLERSLQRMSLKSLDVYFVHNPECQLQEVPRPLVMDRLRRAFQALEQAADDGLIRAYGVATWTGLRARPEERDYLSLQEILGLAHEVAGIRHRCRAVALPLSVRMPEAWNYPNQQVGGRWVSAIEAARHFGLVTLAAAPLQQGIVGRGGPEAVAQALQFARSVPGVASSLVGMSQIAHVRDNAALLGHPRWGADQLAAQRLRA